MPIGVITVMRTLCHIPAFGHYMDNAPSARRLNVEEDKEYEDLWKAERKVARDKKKNNYRIVSVPCCLTCKNAYFGYEGEIDCSELHNERWIVNGVDNLGICDKYAMRA